MSQKFGALASKKIWHCFNLTNAFSMHAPCLFVACVKCVPPWIVMLSIPVSVVSMSIMTDGLWLLEKFLCVK